MAAMLYVPMSIWSTAVFFFSVTADVNGDSLMKLDGQWLNLEATHELNFPGE